MRDRGRVLPCRDEGANCGAWVGRGALDSELQSENAPGMWCCNVCRQDGTHGGLKRKREAEKDLGGFGYCQADVCQGKDDG